MANKRLKDPFAASLEEALDGDLPVNEAIQVAKSLAKKPENAPIKEFTAFDGVPVPSEEQVNTPDKARQWAQQAIDMELPRAAQEVINQLKTGDKKQRYAVAIEMLNRGGVAKKEDRAAGQQVFILGNDVLANLPWTKVPKQVQVIDAEVVNAKKDGK